MMLQHLLLERVVAKIAKQRQQNDGEPEYGLAVERSHNAKVLGCQANLGTDDCEYREKAHPEDHGAWD
jgi:hypothetical protein